MSDFDINEKLNELNDTKDTTAEYDPADVESNKIMGALAYISWLVLIPLFFAKDSRFARFHCNQGLVLAIAEIAAYIILGVLSGFPLIGWIAKLVSSLLYLVCVVFAILGLVNALNGKAKELPFIGSFRLLK